MNEMDGKELAAAIDKESPDMDTCRSASSNVYKRTSAQRRIFSK